MTTTVYFVGGGGRGRPYEIPIFFELECSQTGHNTEMMTSEFRILIKICPTPNELAKGTNIYTQRII